MSGQLTLVVMSREGVVLVPILWERPELFIGRDPECDVYLADAKVSRKHARLTRDPASRAPLITDLDSRNGTTLDGQRLEPSRPVPLAEGSILRIGDAVLVLEERRGTALPRRVARGEAFDLRVDAEITRAAAEGTTLAIVEIGLEGAAGGEGFGASTTAEGREGLGAALAAERAFSRAFRDDDVLAAFGDGAWRALLPRTSAAQARQLVARLRLLLEESGYKPALRLALFPRHGVTSEALTLALESAGDAGIESSLQPVSTSGPMAGLGPLIERVAPSPANVLLVGETGVGKEVLARTIHERSPRAGRPLICLNCAALSETLLESELFGHERGAFTGAVQAKPGLLEVAEQGTVLFDEIGEMPLALQAKLLRVLEGREATRVGGLKPRKIEARFIFATHRDLEQEVAAGRFRQDLYFRINTITIAIPPLRARKSEIGALAAEFVAHACESMRRPDPPRLSPQALALLEAYSWPGNVRELRNVIERAVVLSTGPLITLEHLPLERFRGPGALPPPPPRAFVAPAAPAPRAPNLTAPPAEAESDERARIVRALERCAGNQSEAAKLLGISRRTLVSRLSKYGLPRPRGGRKGEESSEPPGPKLGRGLARGRSGAPPGRGSRAGARGRRPVGACARAPPLAGLSFMRVVQIENAFGLERLALRERPAPSPGPRQVRLRVRAASLNYRDLMMVEGRYNPRQRLPLVPCSDGVGEVVEVGPGVTRVKPGQRVCPTFSQRWLAGDPGPEAAASTLGGPLDGALADEMVVDEEGLVEPPAHLSDEQAATLPCAALTAWSALVTSGGVKAGDVVVVLGTGGVSVFALQFAALLGAEVVVTSSSDEKLERARALGARHLVNYKKEPAWSKAVRAATGGRGADLVVEVGGAGTFDESLRSVRPGGQVALIGVLSGGESPVNLTRVLMNNVRVQGIFVGHRQGFEAMNRAIASHRLEPVVDRVYPLERAREAFEAMREGAHFGKIALRVAPP